MALRASSWKASRAASPSGSGAPRWPRGWETATGSTSGGAGGAAGSGAFGCNRGADGGGKPRALGGLGALAAAEVIQHMGARPAVSLKALAQENGLL